MDMARTRAQSRGEAQSRKRKAKGLENEEPHPEGAKRKKSTALKESPVPRKGPVGKRKAAKEEAKPTDVERPKRKVTTSLPPSSIITKIDNLIAKYGNLPLSDVGLPSPNTPTPETILAHLLNALLSSARISHAIAKRTLEGLIKGGYHDLKTLEASTWEERVALLDEAGYVRYDYKTATELGNLATFLKDKHESDATKLLPLGSDSASNRQILQDRLKEIKGLGPLGIEIFISTVQMPWPPLCPFIDSRDLKTAEQIGLGKDVKAIYQWLGQEPEKMARLSAALTEIRLEKHAAEFS